MMHGEEYFDDFVNRLGMDDQEFTESEKICIMDSYAFKRYVLNIAINNLKNAFAESVKPISDFVRGLR